MAISYTINYTDAASDVVNKQPFTIMPGEINQTTSIDLPGQGAALYGKHVIESMLHALENFCSANPPERATKGQLWYDEPKETLKVLTFKDGNIETWEPVGMFTIDITEPDETGNLWYDTTIPQLKIFNTTSNEWESVADRYVLKTGDEITGSIRTNGTAVGIAGPNNGTVPSLNLFTPSSTRGPLIKAAQHATVMFNSDASATGEFLISAGTADIVQANNNTSAVLRISKDGVVKIVRNNLDMSTNNKIVNLSPGVDLTDAVNLKQLQDAQDALQTAINTKVNRGLEGDTVSGFLNIVTPAKQVGNNSAIAGEGKFAMAIHGTGQQGGGLLIRGDDTGGEEKGIEIYRLNPNNNMRFSAFNVKVATGNTHVGGTLNVGELTTLSKGITVHGVANLNVTSFMNVDVSTIQQAKHLTTKEYVDTQINANKPSGAFAEINPPVAKAGDIRVGGTGAAMKIEIFGNNAWNVVYPAQWV